MPDIFLSYAHQEADKAKLLAEALQAQGWCVFWDRTNLLPGQDFDEVIETAIENAKCMIVAWSKAAKKSNWVKGEARLGLEANILIPILFEDVKPPIDFHAKHLENFTGWNGDLNSAEFRKLLQAVTRLVPLQQASSATSASPVVTPPKAKSAAAPVNTHTGIETEMVFIPAGEFMMGAGANDKEANSDEQPTHKVRIAGFKLGKYPVTQAQFAVFAEATGHEGKGAWCWDGSEWKINPEASWRNPGFAQSGNDPVTCVSYDDALAYIAWLNQTSGKNYRLTSEAEWEYACRAGTTSQHYWGEGDAKDYAWFADNSGDKTHPVGQKKPNAFGLYDMSGNVWEWVQDNWHENYQGAPDNGSAWETAGADAPRVVRGGSWYSPLHNLRSAQRNGSNPVNRNNSLGFRLAQD